MQWVPSSLCAFLQLCDCCVLMWEFPGWPGPVGFLVHPHVTAGYQQMLGTPKGLITLCSCRLWPSGGALCARCQLPLGDAIWAHVGLGLWTLPWSRCGAQGMPAVRQLPVWQHSRACPGRLLLSPWSQPGTQLLQHPHPSMWISMASATDHPLPL